MDSIINWMIHFLTSNKNLYIFFEIELPFRF